MPFLVFAILGGGNSFVWSFKVVGIRSDVLTGQFYCIVTVVFHV